MDTPAKLYMESRLSSATDHIKNALDELQAGIDKARHAIAHGHHVQLGFLHCADELAEKEGERTILRDVLKFQE